MSFDADSLLVRPEFLSALTRSTTKSLCAEVDMFITRTVADASVKRPTVVTPPPERNDYDAEAPVLRDVGEDDRTRAAVINLAIDWWLAGGSVAEVAKSAKLPEAALEEAIRWRLRRPDREAPRLAGRPAGTMAPGPSSAMGAEIVNLLQHGHSRSEVADRLRCSTGTVAYYAKRWL